MSFSTTGSVAGQSLNAYFNSNTIGSLYTTGGNVGINTTIPAYALDVNGSLNATAATIANIRSTNISSGTLIATTGITAGTGRFTGSLFGNTTLNINNTTTNCPINVSRSGTSDVIPTTGFGGSTVFSFGTRESISDTGFGLLGGVISASGTSWIQSKYSANTSTLPLLLNPLGGNIAVGSTANPSYTLDVTGTGRFTNALYANSSLSVTGNLFADGVIRANYSATISGVTSIRCSPQTNGGEASIGFYPNVNEGGSVWVVGHNLGGLGANTFAIWNGGNRFTILSNGNVNVPGALSKGSGTFEIQHPLKNNPDERLVHSFIEGPRCDLIYRGTVQLVNGTANVNIDSDCVQETESSMTQGTFEALCANPVYYLQNHDSFDRVKASISGNILTITCENTSSTNLIHWMVIAERKDPFIKEWDRTNPNGYLVTEYTKN